jgi:hypothetical protein
LKLLIYCLQVDYILSRIWVNPSKSLCSSWTTPLLLSTMDTTSTVSVMSLYTVDVTACLLVALLFPVVTTAAFSTAWCQSAVVRVWQFPLQTPSSLSLQTSHSFSICACLDDLLFCCLGNKSLWRLSGTCLIIGLP